MDERDVVVAAEQLDHFLRLARAQQAVIDEDAGELVADGFVDQHGSDRRIHAARQAADNAPLSGLGADAAHFLGAKRLHVPIGRDAGDGALV